MVKLLKKFILNTKLFYFSIFFVFSFIFLGHYIIAGQAVYGDGIKYYAWLRSAYFDQDINFLNESIHRYNYENNNGYLNLLENPPKLTSAGKVGNFHMPGMAILLFPFYFLADVIAIILNLFGFNFLRNGYSNIYQNISGLGAVFYGTLGIFITENLIKNLFIKDKKMSLLKTRFSVITVVLASPIFYYISIDVLNSHFATFFLISLFLYILFVKKTSYLKFALLGAVLGLATWTRIQEIALLAPLCIFLVFEYFNKEKIIKIIHCFLISLIVFLISIIPLLVAWQYLYGSIFLHPYIADIVKITNTNFLASLIDPINGLFTKTPFMLFLLLFLPATYKNFRKELLILIIFLLIQIIGITKYGGWIAASYGARMYISSFPLFFLLSGMFFAKIKNKLILAFVIIFFVVLNMVNILNFMLFDKEAANGKKGLEPSTKIRIEKILNRF